MLCCNSTPLANCSIDVFKHVYGGNINRNEKVDF